MRQSAIDITAKSVPLLCSNRVLIAIGACGKISNKSVIVTLGIGFEIRFGSHDRVRQDVEYHPL